MGFKTRSTPLLKAASLATQSSAEVFPSQTVCDRVLKKENFEGVDLSGSTWESCTFELCNFTNANLRGAKFVGCHFYLGGATHGANADEAQFHQCKFTVFQFDESSLRAAMFVEMKLADELYLCGSDARKAHFDVFGGRSSPPRMNLRGTRLEGARLAARNDVSERRQHAYFEEFALGAAHFDEETQLDYDLPTQRPVDRLPELAADSNSRLGRLAVTWSGIGTLAAGTDWAFAAEDAWHGDAKNSGYEGVGRVAGWKHGRRIWERRLAPGSSRGAQLCLCGDELVCLSDYGVGGGMRYTRLQASTGELLSSIPDGEASQLGYDGWLATWTWKGEERAILLREHPTAEGSLIEGDLMTVSMWGPQVLVLKRDEWIGLYNWEDDSWNYLDADVALLADPECSVVGPSGHVAFAHEGDLTLFDGKSGKKLFTKALAPDRKRPPDIAGLTFSPSGRFLAVIRGIVTIWDVEQQKEVGRFEKNAHPMHSVSFLGDEKILLANGQKGEAPCVSIYPRERGLKVTSATKIAPEDDAATYLGEVGNSNHHACPIVFVDHSIATEFTGWDDFEDEILEDPNIFDLSSGTACIAGMEDRGEGHLFQKDGLLVLAGGFEMDEADEEVDRSKVAMSFDQEQKIGSLLVPSGVLVMSLAYNPISTSVSGVFPEEKPSVVTQVSHELLLVPVSPGRYQFSEAHDEQALRIVIRRTGPC